MEEKNRHTILLVDDEESITNSLNRLFRKEGYDILTASSPREAFEILKNHKNSLSLIISDQRMPEISGAKFLEKVKEFIPDAIRFLMTGYADMDAIIRAINQGEIHRYISKPWNDNDLLLQVRQALEQYDLTMENRRLLALTQKQNEELSELNRDLEKKVEERSHEIINKNKKLSVLNNELESNLYDTVRAFASLTEMHAPSLAGHGRRVGNLAREIATLFDLAENEITQIEIAGLLHDTGKIGLPNKLIEYGDSNLSPEEKKLFRRHPEEGQGIIRFIKKLSHVGLLVRSHHERYDGEGYPDKLAEDSIPLGSKIIAVADSWDRITKLKFNSKAIIKDYLNERKITQDEIVENELLQQAAIHHLKQNAFIVYDPDVVKVFLNLINTKGIKESQQKTLTVNELKKGMVLAISLYTSRGRFLLPHKTVLTGDLINKLKAIHKIDPIRDVICAVG
jgi:response regulator RpfG family c-di-GMP phosphodiesterase